VTEGVENRIVRPRGHDALLDRLEQTARASRETDGTGLGHAFLFCGPGGVGKFEAARWWATRLKCESPADCSGECPQCRQIAVGSHPDLVVLEPPEPGRAIGIPRIREELLPALSRRNLQPSPKIAIVRDAHLLTPEAQSATLKLLEEPPGACVIVLVTERPSAMYATIRSRCQTVRFGRVPAETIAELLAERGREAETARRAAELARGSVGVALEYTAERLEDRDELVRGFESVCSGGDLEGLVAELVERRKEGRAGLETLLAWQVARVESGLGYAAGAESATLDELASEPAPRETSALIAGADRIRATITALERNVNAKMAIRDLLLDLRST
jgi:DNA polymerase-3 subunit delta'